MRATSSNVLQRAPGVPQVEQSSASEGYRDVRYHPDANSLQRTQGQFAHLIIQWTKSFTLRVLLARLPPAAVCVQPLADSRTLSSASLKLSSFEFSL